LQTLKVDQGNRLHCGKECLEDLEEREKIHQKIQHNYIL